MLISFILSMSGLTHYTPRTGRSMKKAAFQRLLTSSKRSFEATNRMALAWRSCGAIFR